MNNYRITKFGLYLPFCMFLLSVLLLLLFVVVSLLLHSFACPYYGCLVLIWLRVECIDCFGSSVVVVVVVVVCHVESLKVYQGRSGFRQLN